MKRNILSLLFVLTILSCATIVKAQVGIGTTTPSASAQLEVNSTSKGFLPPRMTGAQRNAIASPVAGLMVYCTNCGGNGGEPQFYNGSAWVNMVGGTALLPLPSIAPTTAASNITSSTAISGGNVTSDGGYTITSRGVCWSTSQNPTTADVKTTDTGRTGVFSSNLSGLSTNTTYYVRAYVTNAMGTSYGTQVSFTTLPIYSIGNTALGGKVAYILVAGDPGYDANVQHGLIAATSDHSSTIRWYNGSSVTTGATATALGTGFANTNTIIQIQGSTSTTYAAGIARAHNGGGFNDWYLPSKDELYKLYLNQTAIGGFTGSWYYSSSESGSSTAWLIGISSAMWWPNNKWETWSVRAVRSF
jgi:hypothetical protein